MSTQQIGTALTARAHYTNSGASATGLTVTVDVYNPAGTQVVTGGTCTEIGDGIYEYTLASGSNTTAGNYTYVFDTAGTVDQRNIAGQWTVGQTWVERIDATVSSRSSHSAADVWAVGTRTLTSFGTLVSDVATAVWAAGSRTLTSFGTLTTDTATEVWAAATRTLTSFGSLASDVWAAATRTLSSAGDAAIADAVWDEAIAGHVTAGSTGEKLNNASAPSAADVADAVWDEALSGHATAGSAGAKLTATSTTTELDAVETAILAAIAALDVTITIDIAELASSIVNELRGEVSVLRSPVESQSEITIRVGDDYLSAYDRALTFTITGSPELVGATANLAIQGIRVATGAVTDGGVDGDGNTVQNVTIEVTDTESALLSGVTGLRKVFSIQLVKDGVYMTEFSGTATVLAAHPSA